MNYELWLAALCLWREGRGQSLAALAAIWSVINNRATDALRRWPRSVSDVILEPKQFSSFNIGDPNAVKFPTTSHPEDWKAFIACQNVVLTNIGEDTTHGANAYESLPDGAKKPAWAEPLKMTCQIGPFRFYKL